MTSGPLNYSSHIILVIYLLLATRRTHLLSTSPIHLSGTAIVFSVHSGSQSHRR